MLKTYKKKIHCPNKNTIKFDLFRDYDKRNVRRTIIITHVRSDLQ